MKGLLRLNKKEQFEELKKGDVIVVKWSENYVKHHPGERGISAMKEYELYYIAELNHERGEVICRKRGNHYFKYSLYLEGLGGAKDVYLVAKS